MRPQPPFRLGGRGSLQVLANKIASDARTAGTNVTLPTASSSEAAPAASGQVLDKSA